jgi:hypothetical protein
VVLISLQVTGICIFSLMKIIIPCPDKISGQCNRKTHVIGSSWQYLSGIAMQWFAHTPSLQHFWDGSHIMYGEVAGSFWTQPCLSYISYGLFCILGGQICNIYVLSVLCAELDTFDNLLYLYRRPHYLIFLDFGEATSSFYPTPCACHPNSFVYQFLGPLGPF